MHLSHTCLAASAYSVHQQCLPADMLSNHTIPYGPALPIPMQSHLSLTLMQEQRWNQKYSGSTLQACLLRLAGRSTVVVDTI
jgi:hypothetical protein